MSPGSPFRGVLWDFGGVLSSSPFEAFAAYERRPRHPRGVHPVGQRDQPRRQRVGSLRAQRARPRRRSTPAFAAESEALGHRVEGRQVIARLGGELRPEMVEAVKQCRVHGLVTGLLTNNVVVMDGWAGPLDLDRALRRRGRVGA